MRRVAKSKGRLLPFCFLLKLMIFSAISIILKFLKSINGPLRCFTILSFLICLYINLLLEIMEPDSENIYEIFDYLYFFFIFNFI